MSGKSYYYHQKDRGQIDGIYAYIFLIVGGILACLLCYYAKSMDSYNDIKTKTNVVHPTIAPTLGTYPPWRPFNAGAPTRTPTRGVYPTYVRPSATPPSITLVPRDNSVITQPDFCNCSRDYDCINFATHQAAQSCYLFCGGNNWSALDADRDGIACESLP